MAQLQKMELQVEIKSSGARVFQVFRSKLNLLRKMAPGIVKDVKIVKGDWGSVGSIMEWSYVVGDSETGQHLVEAIDDENKTITWKCHGESISKYYKTFKVTAQIIGNSVKWTVEYEKQNDDVPPPTKYMDVVPILTKNVDDYLSINP